jgi:hypothetical protein
LLIPCLYAFHCKKFEDINIDDNDDNNYNYDHRVGYVMAPQSGLYTFTLSSDYGVMMSVNGTSMINQVIFNFDFRLTSRQRY